MRVLDCLVVGGGMVGAATALSLAELGLQVGVVEAYEPKAYCENEPFDLRMSAISIGSEQLLDNLNAWQQVTQWRVCPYKRLGVWENELAYAEFNSDEIGTEHLGHIVENRLIQLSLWQQMQKKSNVSFFCPEQLVSYQQHDDMVEVQLSEHTIQTRLLIGADGAQSKVRNLANIGTTGWDYQQSAMLINVETEQGQQDITWQHFTETGPVALLPMPGNHASLVWYHHRDKIKELVNLDNSQLALEIKKAFPGRLGNIHVVDKASFNLTRRHANKYVANRVILLGDSAHTINPLAGQGVNIGFKDVKALSEVIATAIEQGQAFDDVQVLAQYEKQRRNDNLLMMSAMDAIYLGFKNQFGPVKLLRNIGVFAAHRAPFLKKKALQYACGL